RRDGEGDAGVLVDVVGGRRSGQHRGLGDRVDGERNGLRRRGGDVAVVIGARRDGERDGGGIVVGGVQREAGELSRAQRDAATDDGRHVVRGVVERGGAQAADGDGGAIVGALRP